MSLTSIPVLTSIPGFPRVSGDEPGITTAIREKIAFSPRERG